MAIPDYGAAPLAKTFILVRAFSLLTMVGILGMTANFVSEIVSANVDPPHAIIGALVITCLAALYCLISIPFFLAKANIGLLIMTGLDSAILLAFVVVSVVLGRPLSFLNCMIIDSKGSAAGAYAAQTFAQSLASSWSNSGSTLPTVANWAGSTRTNCLETKAVWGLCVALCIFFTCSILILPTLFFKAKKAGGGAPAKSVV